MYINIYIHTYAYIYICMYVYKCIYICIYMYLIVRNKCMDYEYIHVLYMSSIDILICVHGRRGSHRQSTQTQSQA